MVVFVCIFYIIVGIMWVLYWWFRRIMLYNCFFKNRGGSLSVILLLVYGMWLEWGWKFKEVCVVFMLFLIVIFFVMVFLWIIYWLIIFVIKLIWDCVGEESVFNLICEWVVVLLLVRFKIFVNVCRLIEYILVEKVWS